MAGGPRVPRRTTVVRLVLGGDGLAGFAPEHADSYVKLVMLTPGVDYPEPLDLNGVQEVLPSEHWPRLRTYTVRAWDPGAAELTVDVVVHGTAGLAGPWAAAAQVGDTVHLLGPGGGYEPDPGASAYLFIGDESALPAIAAALERIPAGGEVRAYVEVDGPADELPTAHPVEWVHRGTGALGAALVAAVTATPVRPGTEVFLHGEAGFVRDLRRWLREQGLDPRAQSISGYWRLGDDDEGWRQGKRQWLAEATADDAA